MTTLRNDLRGLIAKYGLPAVHSELQSEMRETYEFLRQMFDPSKNNLVIPMIDKIPDRIATPHLKPIQITLPADPPTLELSTEGEVQEEKNEQEMSLKEVVIQTKAKLTPKFS